MGFNLTFKGLGYFIRETVNTTKKFRSVQSHHMPTVETCAHCKPSFSILLWNQP